MSRCIAGQILHGNLAKRGLAFGAFVAAAAVETAARGDAGETEVKRQVDEATEKCKAAPPPPLEIIATDVYADGGFAWRN